jgi:DNA repair protein RecO (recombination protein O)
MARTYKSEGIILRRQEYREQDVLLRILTRDFGKLTARAISARKANAKLSGHLEPFIETDLFFAASKGIDIVAGSNTIESNALLRQSFEHTAVASYFIDIVDGLTRDEDVDVLVYEHVRKALTWFASHPTSLVVLHAALLQLAQFLGYSIELYDCHQCKRRMTSDGAKIHYKLWSLECAQCSSPDHTTPLGVDAIKALRFMHENDFDSVSRLAVTDASWRDIDVVVRALFRYHLDSRVTSEAVFLQLVSTGRS